MDCVQANGSEEYNCNSSLDSEELAEVPNFLYWTLIIIYSLATLFGTLGNVLIILAVSTLRVLRTPSNILVGNLAISDLLISVTMIPFIHQPSLDVVWTYDEFLCKFMNALSGSAVFCSSITISCISVERLIGVKTIQPKSRDRWTYAMIAFTWLSAVIFTLPILIFQQKKPLGESLENVTYYICTLEIPNKAFYMTYNVVIMLFIYFIPFAVILFTNAKLRSFLRSRDRAKEALKGQRRLSGHEEKLGNHKVRPKDRILFILVTMAICYGVLRLPYITMYVFLEVFDTKNYNLVFCLNLSALCISNLCVCVNPVLYAFLNKNFQRAIKGKAGHMLPERSLVSRRMTNKTCSSEHMTNRINSSAEAYRKPRKEDKKSLTEVFL